MDVFLSRRSLGSTAPLDPVKVWDYDMSNGRSIKLDLPQTDTICTRSVCRNSQVKLFTFAIEYNVQKNTIINIFLGKNSNWLENIRYY